MSTAWGRLPPAEVQQLEHLVEGGRVAALGVADREQPLEVARDQVALEQRLTGPHPVAVAPQGVDLAVVGQVPVRDGPAATTGRCWSRSGECTSARPLSKRSVGQVGVEIAQLVAGEHALVDEGAGRQRREVDAVHLVLDALAQAEGEPVDAEGVDRPVGRGGAGRRSARRPATAPAWPAGRCRPGPSGSTGTSRQADDGQALLVGQLLDPTAAPWWRRRGRRAGRRCPPRSRPARAGRHPRAPREEAVGHLDEDPGPVTGGRLGTAGAPVAKVLQGGEGLVHHARGCAGPWRSATRAMPQASCSKPGS